MDLFLPLNMQAKLALVFVDGKYRLSIFHHSEGVVTELTRGQAIDLLDGLTEAIEEDIGKSEPKKRGGNYKYRRLRRI